MSQASTSRVSVLDLGMGNLRSVVAGLQRAGGAAEIIERAEQVRLADALVVPGQGAFGDAVKRLEGGLGEALVEYIGADKPLLGICLGMQLLFSRSAESPGAKGLGVLHGEVEAIPRGRRDAEGRLLKVPHMGWNDVSMRGSLPSGYYYFTHSFRCVADEQDVAGVADYIGATCAAVRRGPLVGVQFHPEKSHRVGRALLRCWLEEARCV